MAINFPTSPSNGDTVTEGNITYTYNATKGYWVSTESSGGGGSSVTVSDTAPTSPSDGDQWFDSADGSLSVYYNDGSSSQWISTSGPAGVDGANGTDGTDAASGSSVTSYANLAAFPSSGNTAGDFGFATDTKAIYVWDGTEWDRINSGSDALPEITTPLPAELYISPSAASVITIAASDPDGFPITYDFDTNPTDVSSLVSSISNANNGTFTINAAAGAGSFTFRAKANDGVHTAITTSVINLIPTTPILNSISPALPGGQTSWDFDTDGSELNLDAGETYTFTSAGSFAVDFEVFGAGGGSNNYAYASYKGGGAGRTTGRTTLQWQETYTLVVGGKGREGGIVPSGGSQGSGGDGGGAQNYSNAGGGDLSGLFKGSGDIATFAAQGHNSSSHTPIAIAGGGGGSGAAVNGGIGGGTSGGVVSPQSGTIPAGGSQTAGGTGGVSVTQNGADGVYLIGGQGAGAGGNYTGSGAGGGYFGGGGGGYESSAYIQGAAGGSGYFNASLVTNGVLTDGDTTSVALTYLDGTSQTSGAGAQNGSDNGTDGRVKLTKVT